MLCLHLLAGCEYHSRKHEKLPNIVIYACLNITEKNNLVKKCSPQGVADINVETVKKLDFNK